MITITRKPKYIGYHYVLWYTTVYQQIVFKLIEKFCRTVEMVYDEALVSLITTLENSKSQAPLMLRALPVGVFPLSDDPELWFSDE